MPEHFDARPAAAEGRGGASWGMCELGRSLRYIHLMAKLAMMTAPMLMMNGQAMSSHVAMPGVVPMAGLCGIYGE